MQGCENQSLVQTFVTPKNCGEKPVPHEPIIARRPCVGKAEHSPFIQRPIKPGSLATLAASRRAFVAGQQVRSLAARRSDVFGNRGDAEVRGLRSTAGSFVPAIFSFVDEFG